MGGGWWGWVAEIPNRDLSSMARERDWFKWGVEWSGWIFLQCVEVKYDFWKVDESLFRPLASLNAELDAGAIGSLGQDSLQKQNH